MLNLGIINHLIDLIQYITSYTNMSTHLPPGSVLLRSQLTQSPLSGGSSQAQLGGSLGRPTASYNDFIKDIYNGIKSINNSINQITNSVIRMEQRLDTLETGLATLTTKLDSLSETVLANSADKQQPGDAESMLLTRLDLMDVGCLLEPQLTTLTNHTLHSQINDNTRMNNENDNSIMDNSSNNQKVMEFNTVTEEFDTLILE
jgi:uncharacterized coiled-coil protein SlyX